MPLTDSHKSTLRQLIGSAVSYRGKTCVVVEVLEEDATLVLQATGLRDSLQADQYGEAGRHVAEVFVLPLLEEDGSFHSEFCKLGLSAC
jgi:hypothetical protein